MWSTALLRGGSGAGGDAAHQLLAHQAAGEQLGLEPLGDVAGEEALEADVEDVGLDLEAGEEGALEARITSYNVCYTKLLRLRLAGGRAAQALQGHRQVAGKNRRGPTRGVITSYSIHYTKLYDHVNRHVPARLSADGGGSRRAARHHPALDLGLSLRLGRRPALLRPGRRPLRA